jgi:catechol 2,3-dioxygenase-like lactoylglutathione lyase family enzyme
MALPPPTFTSRAITVYCTDRELSRRFYEDVLSAERLPRDIGDWFRIGDLIITLCPNAERMSPVDFPTHAATSFWLEVPDLDTARTWFERHSVRVVDPGDESFVMIADPDGILIEVWQSTGDSPALR